MFSCWNSSIESALTGNYSIFYDYFGFEESIFYKYKNKLVFNNWEKLWIYVQNTLKEESMKKNYWEDLYKFIDPYMDGKSFNRIEEFSNNLLTNFYQIKIIKE